ncbi:hypothetical protein COBT_002116 [Conglomerata obtusa]
MDYEAIELDEIYTDAKHSNNLSCQLDEVNKKTESEQSSNALSSCSLNINNQQNNENEFNTNSRLYSRTYKYISSFGENKIYGFLNYTAVLTYIAYLICMAIYIVYFTQHFSLKCYGYNTSFNFIYRHNNCNNLYLFKFIAV